MSDRKRESGSEAVPYKVGDAVKAEWYGSWWNAEVVEVKQGKVKVHYDGWSSQWDELVPTRRVRPASQPDAEEDYDTYEEEEYTASPSTGAMPVSGGNQTTQATRTKPVRAETQLRVGDRVQGEWYGYWWEAEVLAVRDDGKVRVHWTGWDKSWDETVPRSRLRIVAPDAWEGLEGRQVVLHFDGTSELAGTVLESATDYLVVRRSGDGKRCVVNRARITYCETDEKPTASS
jgi:hypothetical protein